MIPRLIATDMDGTLIRSDLTISGRNQRAVAAARAAGITVVAATGRGFRSAGEILLQVSEITTAICSNGALIRDLSGESTLESWPVDPVVIGRAHDVLVRADPDVALAWELTDGTFFANAPYLDLRPDMAERWPDALVNEPKTEAVVKLLARSPSRDEAQFLGLISDVLPSQVVATSSGFANIEITGDGVHKGAALAWLCQGLGIDAADVMAIGDNLNDIGMLRWAGTGVAMGNALPEVVLAADTKTTDNDHDGVAVAIEEVL